MDILGIETSCDETGVALFRTGEGLLAHALHSQVDAHAVYGGVVPEIASRDHIRMLLPLIQLVLDEAGIERPDAIAYTAGPGLVGRGGRDLHPAATRSIRESGERRRGREER